MRIRSFIIAYALVLAILLFADRRPSPISQDRYSHVIDLTNDLTTAPNDIAHNDFAHNTIAPNDAAKNSASAAESLPASSLLMP